VSVTLNSAVETAPCRELVMFLNGAPDADYEADPARFFALFMAFATELDAAHAHVVAADAKVCLPLHSKPSLSTMRLMMALLIPKQF